MVPKTIKKDRFWQEKIVFEEMGKKVTELCIFKKKEFNKRYDMKGKEFPGESWIFFAKATPKPMFQLFTIKNSIC